MAVPLICREEILLLSRLERSEDSFGNFWISFTLIFDERRNVGLLIFHQGKVSRSNCTIYSVSLFQPRYFSYSCGLEQDLSLSNAPADIQRRRFYNVTISFFLT